MFIGIAGIEMFAMIRLMPHTKHTNVHSALLHLSLYSTFHSWLYNKKKTRWLFTRHRGLHARFLFHLKIDWIMAIPLYQVTEIDTNRNWDTMCTFTKNAIESNARELFIIAFHVPHDVTIHFTLYIHTFGCYFSLLTFVFGIYLSIRLTFIWMAFIMTTMTWLVSLIFFIISAKCAFSLYASRQIQHPFR